jgi:non-homologous end joining protein Ku
MRRRAPNETVEPYRRRFHAATGGARGLSLVLIPVRLIPAVSTEEAISFRQIHEPSGTPIKQVKGVRDGELSPKVP